MAKAVQHTGTTYNPFATKISAKGYQPANKKEIENILDQLEAISPYDGKEPSMMEEGWTYFAIGKGLRVYIWTSFVKSMNSTRVGWDSGKLIITESNKVVYYGPEIRRTEFFFERLLMWADILKERVDHRPECKHCKRLMTIYHSDNGQYYWRCYNTEHEFVSERWDVGITSEVSLKFLKQKRNRTRKYNKMRLKQSKEKHGTARKKKRSWKYKQKNS